MTHPEHDCPECGVSHKAWTVREAERRRREEEWEADGCSADDIIDLSFLSDFECGIQVFTVVWEAQDRGDPF